MTKDRRFSEIDVLSVMLYPNDDKDSKKARADFKCVALCRQVIRNPERHYDTNACRRLLSVMYDLRESPYALWKSQLPKIMKCLTVAELLRVRIACAFYYPKHWSKAKTRARRTNDLMIYMSKNRITQSYVKKAWKDFRFVAHLWAALGYPDIPIILDPPILEDLSRDFSDRVRDWWNNFDGISDLHRFLAISEVYRKYGEEHKALMPRETVKLAEGMNLPDLSEEILIWPFSSESRSYLDRYYVAPDS